MTNQPVTPLTAEAGPRCTCTPPDGVTQNHGNYCPLFKVRAAYAQGWADATLDAARTPSQPDLREALRALAEEGRDKARAAVRRGDSSKAWGRGAESAFDWLLMQLTSQPAPAASQPAAVPAPASEPTYEHAPHNAPEGCRCLNCQSSAPASGEALRAALEAVEAMQGYVNGMTLDSESGEVSTGMEESDAEGEMRRSADWLQRGPVLHAIEQALASQPAPAAVRDTQPKENTVTDSALLIEAVSTLENYGEHHEWCSVYEAMRGQHPYAVEDCTCGYSKALFRLRHAETCPCGATTEDEHDTRDAE